MRSARLLTQEVDELSVLLAQSDPDADGALFAFETARARGEVHGGLRATQELLRSDVDRLSDDTVSFAKRLGVVRSQLT